MLSSITAAILSTAMKKICSCMEFLVTRTFAQGLSYIYAQGKFALLYNHNIELQMLVIS